MAWINFGLVEVRKKQQRNRKNRLEISQGNREDKVDILAGIRYFFLSAKSYFFLDFRGVFRVAEWANCKKNCKFLNLGPEIALKLTKTL